jgi:hypothetical protein
MQTFSPYLKENNASPWRQTIAKCYLGRRHPFILIIVRDT